MREHAVVPTSAALEALPDSCVSALVCRVREGRREETAVAEHPPTWEEPLHSASIDSHVVEHVLRLAKLRRWPAQARGRDAYKPFLLPTCRCRYCTSVGASFRREWVNSRFRDTVEARHRDYPQQEAVWAQNAACLGWRSALARYARVEANRLRSDDARHGATWAGGAPRFDASEAAFAATADAVRRRPHSPGRDAARAVASDRRGGDVPDSHGSGRGADATPLLTQGPGLQAGATGAGGSTSAAALVAECRAAAAAALETHREHVRRGTVPSPSYPHRARALAATASCAPPEHVLREIVETSRLLRGAGAGLLGVRQERAQCELDTPAPAPPEEDDTPLDVESIMAQSRALRAEAQGTLL